MGFKSGPGSSGDVTFGDAATDKLTVTGELHVLDQIGIQNTVPGSLLEVSKVSGQASLELSSWSTTATAAHAGALILQKSGIATVNTFGAGAHTTDSEVLGRVEGWGVTNDDDGSNDIAKLSSYIEFANDAVSREGTVPGKIIFATAANSDDATPTVRLTIDDDGTATFTGDVAITGDLNVNGGDATIQASSGNAILTIKDNDAAATTPANRVYIQGVGSDDANVFLIGDTGGSETTLFIGARMASQNIEITTKSSDGGTVMLKPRDGAGLTVETDGLVTHGAGSHAAKAPTLITAITADDPGVITAAGHGLSNNDRISIMGVKGMTEDSGPNSYQSDGSWVTHTVAGVSGDDFNIGVDTSGHTAWASGGIISTPFDMGASNNCGDYCELTSNTRSGFVTITLGAQLNSDASATLFVASNKIKDGDVILIQKMETGAFAAATVYAHSVVEGSFAINIDNYSGSHIVDNSVLTFTWMAL